MDTNARTMMLARLDKDLRGVESPYSFRAVHGAGRARRYRIKKKTGSMLTQIMPGPFAGFGAFVDGRRVA